MITMLVPQPEIRTPLSTPIAWRDEKRSIVAKGLEPASGAASPIATTQDGRGWLQIAASQIVKDVVGKKFTIGLRPMRLELATKLTASSNDRTKLSTAPSGDRPRKDTRPHGAVGWFARRKPVIRSILNKDSSQP